MSTSNCPAAVAVKADPNKVAQFEEADDVNAIKDAKTVNFVTDNSNEVSNYADWTFFQTVRHFWRAMAISFACGICAMGDGYQYKMPGNIVALDGFIKQMGNRNAETGAYALDSQHVAAWGGESRINIARRRLHPTTNYICRRVRRRSGRRPTCRKLAC